MTDFLFYGSDITGKEIAMGRKVSFVKNNRGEIDFPFIKEHLGRVMEVSDAVWIAESIGCSPHLIYAWMRSDNQRFPSSILHIWVISVIESIIFNLDKGETFKLWLKACGYDLDYGDKMIRAHLKMLEMQGVEIIIKFPSLESSPKAHFLY